MPAHIARRRPLPAQFGITHQHLMHPILCRSPFTAAGWVFEHKLDGFRVLARKAGDEVTLLSRNGRSLAEAFPEIAAAIAALPCDAILDGELVVVDPNGHPDWERVRRRAIMRRRDSIVFAAQGEPATLCAFDLLAVDSDDVRDT